MGGGTHSLIVFLEVFASSPLGFPDVHAWCDSCRSQALERANSSEYGLGGSVWGPDAEKAAEVAVQLESGMSWVNQHITGNENAPFGGVKSSGIGREGGGAIGLKEFVDIKSLYVKKLKSGL